MKPLSTEEIFMQLVDKFKKNIESQRNDTRSIEVNRKMWIEIDNTFSSSPGTEKRDPEQLKKCWANMKANAKKTVAQEKREKMRTGGGTFVSQLDPTT